MTWGCTHHVGQWLERRNSNPKTLGSIPRRGRVSRQFFCPSESTLGQTCLCLTPSCVRRSPKYVYTLKIPYPAGIKEAHSWWYGNTKTLHKKEKKLGSAVLWLLAFPRGKQP